MLQSTSDALYPAELGEKRVAIDSRSLEEDTPLHVLVWRKDRYGVQLLIESGADIDTLGDMCETQLHIAVMKKDLPIIEGL